LTILSPFHLSEFKDKIFNELDYIISEEEIMKAINYLKNNKAAGFDIIINEMLKCGQSWI
jgi:hypothetical protein